MKKVVIIGGVAGGASCAARLRRLDEEASIILLERGEYISYANCGLPYHVGDVIKSRDALLLQTPEAMRKKFKVDVRVKNEVLSINREKKTVTVRLMRKVMTPWLFPPAPLPCAHQFRVLILLAFKPCGLYQTPIVFEPWFVSKESK